MHDGSVPTLDAVLDNYARGGRLIASGPQAGDGSKNPSKSPIVAGFPLSPQQRADLKAYLESLTDEEFLHNPAFANPWPSPLKSQAPSANPTSR
jgi:cytochrome c peroxidase